MNFSRWFLLAVVVLVSIAVSCRKHKEILSTPSNTSNGADTVPTTDSPPPSDSIPGTDSLPSDTGDTIFYSMTARSVDIVPNVGGFYEALPYNYDSTQTNYPLLVFLHGGGEVGNGKDELHLILKNGLAERIDNKTLPAYFTVEGVKYSFVALFPQFKKWPAPSEVDAVINYALSHYRVDEHRIYLAGLSMGGGATWDYSKIHGSRLAAMVAICGASTPDADGVGKIAAMNIPTWAFHNNDDDVVPVTNTEHYAEWINALNPVYPVRMTIWPEGGHDAWTKATDPEYKEEGKNMYEWMLQYSR